MDYSTQSMSVDTDNNFPIKIYSPTFVLFSEKKSSENPYNMEDFDEYVRNKNLHKEGDPRNIFIKNIKFEFILKYYKKIETTVKKNSGKQTIFVFKPDIELYQREFEDFEESKFISAFINSYKNYNKFVYFDDIKIRRKNKGKNTLENNVLMEFIPLSIFSNKNVFLSWDLFDTDNNPGRPFLQSSISMNDLKDQQKIQGKKIVGQLRGNNLYQE